MLPMFVYHMQYVYNSTCMQLRPEGNIHFHIVRTLKAKFTMKNGSKLSDINRPLYSGCCPFQIGINGAKMKCLALGARTGGEFDHGMHFV